MKRLGFTQLDVSGSRQKKKKIPKSNTPMELHSRHMSILRQEAEETSSYKQLPPHPPIPEPYLLTEQVANHIIERVELGESIKSISKSPKLPERNHIQMWIRENPEFKRRLKEARAEAQEFVLMDQFIDNIERIQAGTIDYRVGKAVGDMLKFQLTINKKVSESFDPLEDPDFV